MRLLLRLLLAVLLLLGRPEALHARGYSGGGSRSSGGFSSSSSSRSSWGGSSSSSSSRSGSSWGSGGSSGSSWGTSPSGSSWGSGSTGSSASSSRNSGSGWGSSSRFSNSSSSTSPSTGFFSSNTRSSGSSQSATDAALGRKVGQSGTQFSSRAAAVSDFKQKYASQYTTSFAREPSVRPSYIPQTIFISGSSYPVYYDWGYGGYGYWMGPVWHTYNPLLDAVMLGTLMSQNHYVYGPGYGPTYVSSGGSGVIGLFFLVFCIVLLLVVVGWIRRAFAGPRFY